MKSIGAVGIALVKDEADVIERTVRHALAQLDQVLVCDNNSTDGTRDILAALAAEIPTLTVLDDPSLAHYQARKLTALSVTAHKMGAEWVVPFDADELISHETGAPLADVLRRLTRIWIVTVRLLEYVPTDQDDPTEPDPFTRLRWRQRDDNPLLKIMARPHPDLRIHEGSHSADYNDRYPATTTGGLIRHYPVRSPEQFVSKARNGSRGRGATNLGEEISAHLREYGRILEAEGEAGLRRLYFDRFHVTDPEFDPSLTWDPA